MNWLKHAGIKSVALWAQSKNGVIGVDNEIPWHCPADLKFYAQCTRGAIVIIGSNTFESLPDIALKNRLTIVVTSRESIKKKAHACNGVMATSSLEKAYAWAVYTLLNNEGSSFCLDNAVTKREIYFAGGTGIYHEAIEKQMVNCLYMTCVDRHVDIPVAGDNGEAVSVAAAPEIPATYAFEAAYAADRSASDLKLLYKLFVVKNSDTNRTAAVKLREQFKENLQKSGVLINE